MVSLSIKGDLVEDNPASLVGHQATLARVRRAVDGMNKNKNGKGNNKLTGNNKPKGKNKCRKKCKGKCGKNGKCKGKTKDGFHRKGRSMRPLPPKGWSGGHGGIPIKPPSRNRRRN